MKIRNSSIELYRMLAMFLVCIVHWNGWFVPMPDSFSSNTSTPTDIGQIILVSISIPCVNMFLIISGYLGLKLKARSLINLFFQIVSVSVPFYVIYSIWHHSFDLLSFIRCFLAFTHYGYFIQCYVMLMFLSPILNVAIEKYGRRLLTWVLCFWLIEFLLGCIWINADRLGINNGYSLVHFILMYFLARLLYLYRDEILRINKVLWLWGFVLCTIIISLMYVWIGKERAYSYANPFVIVSAFCIFVPFLHYSFYHKGINWIAKRTFTVYIIQISMPVIGLLSTIDTYLLNHHSYMVYLVLSFVVLLILYGGSIVYDYIRSFITDPITHYICEKKMTKVFDKMFSI